MSDVLTAEQTASLTLFLRQHWTIGDALPVAEATGVTYPMPTIPDGLDMDAELVFLLHDARRFISGVYRAIFDKGHA